MALKIIGAGLGRTGTLAMKIALEQLGFGPCYHMIEVMMNPARRAQWEAIIRGDAPDWDGVFEGFSATVDWPACNYYPALMAKYPDANVLLTTRPAADWYASAQVTIFTDKVRTFGGPFIDRLFADAVGPDLSDRAATMAAFDRFNAEVRRTVPETKLLEFNPAEGWEPLCAWLGVPAPETPFPHLNTKEQYQARLNAS